MAHRLDLSGLFSIWQVPFRSVSKSRQQLATTATAVPKICGLGFSGFCHRFLSLGLRVHGATAGGQNPALP